MILEIKVESTRKTYSFSQTRTHNDEKIEKVAANQSKTTSVIAEYQTRLFETQKLHVRACQETSILKKELDELKAQLQIQQSKIDYEARKSFLDEHRNALKILRGRRIADGGNMLQTENALRETNDISSCPLQPVQRLEEVEGFSSGVTSLRPRASPSGGIQSDFRLKGTAKEVTSAIDTAPLPELTHEPVLPFMVSVATSTDDLFELQIDAASESDCEQNIKEWNIRENIFCRENAEGRSRSASPYPEEKESKTGKEEQKRRGDFALDEEVRKLHTA